MKQRTLWAASCGSVSDPDSASGGSQGRLSQQLLSGSVTVDAAVKQPAASDQAG
ncbi:hypothetical protein ACWD1Y_31510 [Streptomyces sp. NPDC002814]